MPDVGKVTGTVEMKDEFSKTFNSFGDKMKKTKIGMGTVAVAAAAVGAILVKSVQAYNKQIQAVNGLNLAMANQGTLLEGTSKRMQEFASEIQKTTTFGDEQILQAQATLATFGLTEEMMKRVTLAAVDMSAATKQDLTKAMLLLGRATTEGGTVLKRYGIDVDIQKDKTKEFADVLDELEKKFAGAAALQAETFAGKMTQVGNAAGDTVEKLGQFVEFLSTNFAGGISNTIVALEELGSFFGEKLPTAISESQAWFAEFMESVFDLGAQIQESKILQAAGIVLGLPKIGTSAADLKVMAEGQRDLATEIRESADATIQALKNGTAFNNKLTEIVDTTDDAADAAKEYAARMKELDASIAEATAQMEGFREEADRVSEEAIEFDISKLDEAIKRGIQIRGEDIPILREKTIQELGNEFKTAIISGLDPLGMFAKGMTDVTGKQKDLIESQKIFNEGMALANDLAGALGGTFGGIIGSITGMGSALKAISTAGGGGIGGLVSGIGSTFSKGMDEAGGKGISGLIGGMTAAIPLIGAAIGPAIQGVTALIGVLFRGPDIGRDVGRDIGVGISEGLENAIAESGKNAQLFVSEIFKEGFASGEIGATADRLAEEIGDIFSGITQGLFTEGEGFTAIEEAIPLLIENFGSLGAAGEAQVERIINAAKEMGMELSGINELIATQMGPTLQDVAEDFNITVQEAKALGELFGKDLPTQMQVLAAQIGTTPKALRDVGAAMEEQLGIPAEQIQQLMETMGVSFAQLAEGLSVKLPEGAGAASEETENLAENTAIAEQNLFDAVGQANLLAEALERAAGASKGISIPSGGGGAQSFAEGGVVSSPTLGVLGDAGPEVAAPVSALFGRLGNSIANTVAERVGDGGNFDVTIAPSISIAEPLASAEAIQNAVLPPLISAIQRDLGGIIGEISRKQERS